MNKKEISIAKSYPVDKYVNKYILKTKDDNHSKFGKNRPILCPFHKENKPSFYFYQAQNKFKCFGCGIYGDVIDLHLKWSKLQGRNITWTTAVSELIEEVKNV